MIKNKFDIFNIGFLTVAYMTGMFIIPGLLGYFGYGGSIVNGNMSRVTMEAFLFSIIAIVSFSITYILIRPKYNLKNYQEYNYEILKVYE